jgi:hypothetical protein
MRLIETQSKTTLANWAISYAESVFVPLYKKTYPADARPERALEAARGFLAGKVKLPYVKDIILNQAHAAAREAKNPVAQGAARAIGQAAACIHTPTHSLGLALYGALAVAYDKVGAAEAWEVIEKTAAEEVAKMQAALCAAAVENEPNPAKLNWNC